MAMSGTANEKRLEPLGAQSATKFSRSVSGLTVYAQAGMFDPGQPSGFAFTNGLEVAICP